MIPVPSSIRVSLAQKFNTTAADLKHFGGGEESSDGIVYAYPCADGRRLLKVMAIPIEDQRRGRLCLEERLRFMRYLGDHDAHIAFPQRSPQGNLYETVSDAGHLWIGYNMAIAPGETPAQDAWDPRLFRNWGQAIGQLHRLALDYPSASLDPESGEPFLTWEEEWEGFYQWCQEDDVRAQWVTIKEQLDALPLPGEPRAFGFIHNDPHIWNLRVDGDRAADALKVTILDFDVANHHWFVNDIAIACQSVLIFLSGGLNGPIHHREKLLGFLEHFMEGYEREHHLATEWLNRLDLFIAYRRILLFIVMYGWVQSQPELYTSWKGLILSPPEVVGEVF
jgi:Ser/Thr protein kinase RdoA (MazF antagonist)